MFVVKRVKNADPD